MDWSELAEAALDAAVGEEPNQIVADWAALADGDDAPTQNIVDWAALAESAHGDAHVSGDSADDDPWAALAADALDVADAIADDDRVSDPGSPLELALVPLPVGRGRDDMEVHLLGYGAISRARARLSLGDESGLHYLGCVVEATSQNLLN